MVLTFDGIINEYYQHFHGILAPYLLATFQTFVLGKPPPREMLAAIITTIPKPGKPTYQVTNYRPISLLNTDIKMYAKILSDRINAVLLSLVHSDQVGFVAKRQVRDGTRLILDLVQLAQKSSNDAILLSLDAEKAFDSINWTYLKAVLSKFGFRGPILLAILSLYSTPSASVLSYGFLSYPFDITNGMQ